MFVRIIKLFLAFVLFVGLGFVFLEYYPFLFSRRVKGVVEAIERIDVPVALIQRAQQPLNPQIFSFSVAIREPSGEIVTASAEDRQWAVVQKGQCAEAVFYPYPPWQVMKSGTYFNARLDKLMDCPK